MALLKGFPPSNLISPSVRIAEVDLSFLPANQTGHRAGLVGYASKGPINVPTLVGSVRELHATFGYPHPDVGDPYLIYAAEQYLQFGSELFIVRVASTDSVDDEAAVTASVDVGTAGGAVAILSNVAGTYSFANDVFFKWRLNGVLASKTLVVLADANRPDPDTGNPYTVTELVNVLNGQLTPAIDGIEFFWTDADTVTGAATVSSKVALRTTYSYGPSSSIELVSVQDALYGPTWNGTSWDAPVSGLGQGMLPASVTGTHDRYPNNSSQTAGTYDFSGLSGLTLNVVVDGTDNILIDNVVQSVTFTAAVDTISQVVTHINTLISNGTIPGGFFAVASGNYLKLSTLHTGVDARLLVKSDSTAATLFGLDNKTHRGVSPAGVAGDGSTYNDGVVTGSANSGGTTCFTVTADSPGIDGNSTKVKITNSVADGNFSLEVYSYGSQVESWGNLSKDETSAYYVESFLSLVSSYVRVQDNTATLALPANGTYSLSGGTDGIPSDPDKQDELLIGSDVAMTGLQALSDPEQVDIDLIAVPGHPSTGNILALLDFCQNTREDCFAIIEPPFGLTVTEIIHWQNGTHPLNDVRFDNDFGALYWPWVKIRDTFNRVDVWVPPAGVVLGAYARSDTIAAPWIAPAGTTRGLLPTVLDVFTRPTLQERDDMYGNRNAVNPIVSMPDIGAFVLNGQKTLQRRPSALDRVNVRRMMLYVEKQMKLRARDLLFEPNDDTTWAAFSDMATKLLTTVQHGRGIKAFKVQCDASTNTADVIDRNEMRARIGVIPTRAVEYIFIEFSIFRSDAFTESANF